MRFISKNDYSVKCYITVDPIDGFIITGVSHGGQIYHLIVNLKLYSP